MLLFTVETITSGEINIELNYETITLVSETLDLCNLASKTDKTCPLQKGVLVTSGSEYIPTDAPLVSKKILALCSSDLTNEHMRIYIYLMFQYYRENMKQVPLLLTNMAE